MCLCAVVPLPYSSAVRQGCCWLPFLTMETVEFEVPVHGGRRKEEQDGTKTPCLFFVVGLVVPTPPKLKLRPFGNFLGDYRGPCTAPSAECNLEG